MVNDGITINVVGELSFNTVPLLHKNNRSLVEQNQKTVFDLSQVTFSDNAGVALLVALTSYAKSIDREIVFIHLPAQLLALVDAANVRDILPINMKV